MSARVRHRGWYSDKQSRILARNGRPLVRMFDETGRAIYCTEVTFGGPPSGLFDDFADCGSVYDSAPTAEEESR